MVMVIAVSLGRSEAQADRLGLKVGSCF